MKSNLFIGSSVEGLDVAYAVQENLDHSVEVTVWSQGVFKASGGTLETLTESLNLFDYAVFVFSADDTAAIKHQNVSVVRDNVIFELGLFIGRIGKERCFFILPRGEEKLHLPTDLLGVTPLTFDAHRSDKNLVAALGPACNQIRNISATKGRFKQVTTEVSNSLPPATPADIQKATERKLLMRAVAQLYENVQPVAQASPIWQADYSLSQVYNGHMHMAQVLYTSIQLHALMPADTETRYLDLLTKIGQLKSILESEEMASMG